MALAKDLEKQFRVPTHGRFRLKDHDPAWAGGDYFPDLSKDELKDRARAYLTDNLDELEAAQQLLWATDRYSVLVVLQAMDADGKDGTIRHVMSGVNPQGCQVFAFKKPSDEELDHTFLWRYTKALPERGRIGIFNRSYYEDVLVVRVHPEILAAQKLPDGKRGSDFWRKRFDDINNFERHLTRNGTVVVKFFLNVSKDEQRRRFMERLTDPDKYWKVSDSDVKEREYWNEYQDAYEEVLRHTSTKWAPWYVIPSDHKWAARVLVSELLTRTIKQLKLKMPTVSPQREKELAAMRRQLEREGT